jgi:hypothetical protein
VFRKQELLRDVWGFRAEGRTRTLDSHASRLRRKLDPESPRYVINCWGVPSVICLSRFPCLGQVVTASSRGARWLACGDTLRRVCLFGVIEADDGSLDHPRVERSISDQRQRLVQQPGTDPAGVEAAPFIRFRMRAPPPSRRRGPEDPTADEPSP